MLQCRPHPFPSLPSVKSSFPPDGKPFSSLPSGKSLLFPDGNPFSSLPSVKSSKFPDGKRLLAFPFGKSSQFPDGKRLLAFPSGKSPLFPDGKAIKHRLPGGRPFGRAARTGRAEPPAGVFAGGVAFDSTALGIYASQALKAGCASYANGLAPPALCLLPDI